MLIRTIKDTCRFKWVDHTEIENVDLKMQLQQFFNEDGDRLYFYQGCYIKPGDLVVSIGCNIGLFAIMAIQSGISALHAFEPNQANFDCAVENVALHATLNGVQFTDCYNKAMSNAVGVAPFFDCPNISQHGLLDHGLGIEPRIVETTTLDECFRQGLWDHIDFLKCSANGAEYMIFSPEAVSSRNLARIDRIGLQYNNWVARYDPQWLTKFAKRMKAAKFTLEMTKQNSFGDCYIHCWRP